jgi:uroporphyrinogen decarboxylase
MPSSSLTPRERFARILAHQEADRVPLDLAGTSLTAIDPKVAGGLRDLLGFLGPPHGLYAAFDERILAYLGIDFRRVGDLISAGDRPLPGRPDRRVDLWGIERAWTGQYWDIVHSPLRGASLADLERYPWPVPERCFTQAQLDGFQAEARRLWQETDTVVVAEHPVYGVLELGCWMCGFDDFLLRVAGEPDFVRRFFDIILDLQKRFIQPYYEAVGGYIHLTTSGDDFGMQTGPLISPRAFRALVKPYYAERIAFTKRITRAAYWHHSCGSVFDLIPDLLECGVEILNPIQPGAEKMEPERLKAAYGDRLTFHGGFDTQNVLPFGTPEQIEAEVARVMRAMQPGGGYIFSAAHNIQDDVPPENVLTMFQAARELGRYPSCP